MIINFEGNSISMDDIKDNHFVFFIGSDRKIYQLLKIDIGYVVVSLPCNLANIAKKPHETIQGAIMHMLRRWLAKGVSVDVYVFEGIEKANRFLSVQLNRGAA